MSGPLATRRIPLNHALKAAVVTSRVLASIQT
jgi:hypothetical protein